MQRAGVVLIAVLAMAMAVCAAALCGVARAESASVLLQEGVYEQDVTGNLDRAMEAYQQVIKDAATDRRYVAEAHYRLGKCLLAKGDKDKAQAEFQQVVQAYADQPGLAAAARTELAKLAPPAASVRESVTVHHSGLVTLGPVVELTVNDDNAGKDFFVDLDAGRLVTPPADLDHSDENAVMTWIRSSRVDAMAETSVSVQGLIGFDMVVQPVASELWDSVTAETILTRDMLATGTGFAPAPMPGKGPLPVTYMFRTREGGLGILQIVGFAEDPKGVKIRYRMVLGAADLPKDVAQLLSLAKALEVFEVDVKRYPTTEEGLQALVTQPAGLAAWRGPYIKMPSGPGGLDRYSYSAPGANGQPFDLDVRQEAVPAAVRTILVPDADATGQALSLDRGELVSLPKTSDQPHDAKSWMSAIAGVGADLFFSKATGSAVTTVRLLPIQRGRHV